MPPSRRATPRRRRRRWACEEERREREAARGCVWWLAGGPISGGVFVRERGGTPRRRAQGRLARGRRCSGRPERNEKNQTPVPLPLSLLGSRLEHGADERVRLGDVDERPPEEVGGRRRGRGHRPRAARPPPYLCSLPLSFSLTSASSKRRRCRTGGGACCGRGREEGNGPACALRPARAPLPLPSISISDLWCPGLDLNVTAAPRAPASRAKRREPPQKPIVRGRWAVCV